MATLRAMSVMIAHLILGIPVMFRAQPERPLDLVEEHWLLQMGKLILRFPQVHYQTIPHYR